MAQKETCTSREFIQLHNSDSENGKENSRRRLSKTKKQGAEVNSRPKTKELAVQQLKLMLSKDNMGK